MSDYYEQMRAVLDEKERTRDHVIPLRAAYLCLDCEAISRGPRCPACDSGALVPVARFLDRPTN